MKLKAKQYFGLIKFFRDKRYLEMFLEGEIYCNTPQFYRNSKIKGVSDRSESCLFSMDEKRGDIFDSCSINGIDVNPPTNFLIRNGRNDGWLHCWAIIDLPETVEEFRCLQQDLSRLQKEFGSYYAFVNAKNSHILAERISSVVKSSFIASKVTYDDIGYLGHSVLKKDKSYSYQREFRFIIDECSNDCEVHKELNIEGGFKDIVEDSPDIIIYSELDSVKYELVINSDPSQRNEYRNK